MSMDFGAIEKELQQKMRTAMQQVKSKNEIDLRTEVHAFYGQGSPTLYTRTGSLATSPHFTGIIGGGNDLYFMEELLYPQVSAFNRQKFLKRGFASDYDGEHVLIAAEYNMSGVLGRGGFWERSLDKIEQNIQTAFSSVGFNSI